ncbi:MAG: hypothetical protein WBN31_15390 [Gammaproteobacteria bacterium]
MPKPILVSLDPDADPPVTVSQPDYVVSKRKRRRIVWKKDPMSPANFKFRYLAIDGGGSMFVNPIVRKRSVEITDNAQNTKAETVFWYMLTVAHKGTPYSSGVAAQSAASGKARKEKQRKDRKPRGDKRKNKKPGSGVVVASAQPLIRNR